MIRGDPGSDIKGRMNPRWRGKGNWESSEYPEDQWRTLFLNIPRICPDILDNVEQIDIIR
jgi:hypothetical protein